MNSRWLVLFMLLSLGVAWGCQNAEQASQSYASAEAEDRFAAPAEEKMAQEVASGPGDSDNAESSGEQSQSKAQRLIYTGRIVLAIYDVDAVQIQAIELIDELEGYISRRSSEQLTVRVPAANFRPALDGLAALGDTLDVTWEAQDVSEQMRDLEIRLQNSLELRDRLEILLDRADTVEDALRIETELERVTLEVERIRGQLQSFEDRVAYSTIVVEFRTIRDEEMPDDEFLLPVAWVNDLGLSSLMRSSGVR